MAFQRRMGWKTRSVPPVPPLRPATASSSASSSSSGGKGGAAFGTSVAEVLGKGGYCGFIVVSKCFKWFHGGICLICGVLFIMLFVVFYGFCPALVS